MPEQARQEMIKYCTAHPDSPTATHRPQLLLCHGRWFALLESSVTDGIVGTGSTVEDALCAFDNRYALQHDRWAYKPLPKACAPLAYHRRPNRMAGNR
jgi:hypothetical protein